MPDERDAAQLHALLTQLPRYAVRLDPREANTPENRGRERQVVGLVKSYFIHDRLHELAENAANTPFDAGAALARIAQSVSVGDMNEHPEERRTPQQRIADLRSGDGTRALVTRIVENYDPATGRMRPGANLRELTAEAANLSRAGALDSRGLTALLNTQVDAGGQRQSLRNLAAVETRLQLTDGGRALTSGTVRLGNVPGRPAYGEQFQSFIRNSDEAGKKEEAFRLFMQNLRREAGDNINLLFPGGRVNVFDIGPGDGIFTEQALQQIGPAAGGVGNISYTGVDVTRPAVQQTGERLATMNPRPAQTALFNGTVGRPPMEEEILNRNLAGSAHVVLASHVYNLGNPQTFLDQALRVAHANGVVYAQHEHTSDAIAFRGNEARTALFRPSGASRAADLTQALRREGAPEYGFTMRSVLTVPRITGAEWQAMANVPTGQFDRGAEVNQEKRNIVEFLLMGDLASFSPEERRTLLTDLRAQLERSNYQLRSDSRTQLTLGRGHDARLEPILQRAADATERELRQREQQQRPQQDTRLTPQTGEYAPLTEALAATLIQQARQQTQVSDTLVTPANPLDRNRTQSV